MPAPEFITAEEVARSLGLDTTDIVLAADIEDALLYLEDEIELYCNYDFTNREDTAIIYDGAGLPIQSLKAPIREVSSVWILDENGVETEEITDYVLCPNPTSVRDGSDNNVYFWIERRQYPGGDKNVFPAGLGNLKITGTWGFETAPYSIKRALVLSVKHYFDTRNYSEIKAAETGSGRSVMYNPQISSIPHIAKTCLAKFKRRTVAD